MLEIQIDPLATLYPRVAEHLVQKLDMGKT